jgi:PIN domain nuclease of toxin-antitoxin system
MLLDTSTLLWVLIDSPRLGPVSRRRIAAAASVHVSPVSVAEIVIKQMLGRLVAPDDLPAELEHQSLKQLPLDIDAADALREFPELTRHDPFDRLLVAQAHARGMDFLTSDRRLLALGRTNILDATE